MIWKILYFENKYIYKQFYKYYFMHTLLNFSFEKYYKEFMQQWNLVLDQHKSK